MRMPRIRFKGFSGEWEEKRLDDIADIVGGGTPSTSIAEYWGGNIDWYSPTEIGNQVYANGSVKKITQLGLEKSSAKILPSDKTILFTSRAGIGDLAILSKDGATNQGFQSLILRDKYDVYFVYSAGFLIKKYALKHSSGSTFLEISGKQLSNMNIIIPDKTEQTKIGNYFQHLDTLIEQKEKKYQKLKQFKTAMLSQIFPKEGERTPELRFKGFSGEWEEKRLDDIADIVGGGTPSTSIAEYWGGNIDWYSPTEIGNQVYANGSVKKITQLGLEKSSAKILPSDKTILFTSRAGIGDLAILSKDGATNQGFQSLILKDKYDTYFVYSSGFLIKKYALKHSSGSTFLEISGKQLSNMNIIIPDINEQIKIGNYFQKLDTLIDLHQKELEKIKNIKKASLEKMFI